MNLDIFLGYFAWSHPSNHSSPAANWLQVTPRAAIVVSSAFSLPTMGFEDQVQNVFKPLESVLPWFWHICWDFYYTILCMCRICQLFSDTLCTFLCSSPKGYFLVYLLWTFHGNSPEHKLSLTNCCSLLESMMFSQCPASAEAWTSTHVTPPGQSWHLPLLDGRSSCVAFFLPARQVLLPTSRANLPPRIFQDVRIPVFRSWCIRKHAIPESTIE